MPRKCVKTDHLENVPGKCSKSSTLPRLKTSVVVGKSVRGQRTSLPQYNEVSSSSLSRVPLATTTTCHVWKVLNAPRSCTTITLLIPGVSCLLLNSTFQEQQIGCCYFAVVVISLAQKASNFLLNRLFDGHEILGLDENWEPTDNRLFKVLFFNSFQILQNY